MVLLRCKCGYIWFYGGHSNYATCPHCHHKISIEKHKIIDEQEIDKWLIEQLKKASEKFPERREDIEWTIETLSTPAPAMQKTVARMLGLAIVKNL